MTLEFIELFGIGAQYGLPSLIVLWLLYERREQTKEERGERENVTKALVDKIDQLIVNSNTHMERISSGIEAACVAIKLMISESQNK